MEYVPGNEEDFAGSLNLEQTRKLGLALIERMKEETNTLEYNRCPVCNHKLRTYNKYKPTWTMIQICLDMIRVMAAGHKHVHIKADLVSAISGHENHTVVGRVVNNYSKMQKLGLISLCDEAGAVLDREDEDVKGGRHARYTITREGYDFVMGKNKLKPAKVSIVNDRIVNVEENAHEEMHVNEVEKYEEDAWLDSVGRYTLEFPEELNPRNTAGFLFPDME